MNIIDEVVKMIRNEVSQQSKLVQYIKPFLIFTAENEEYSEHMNKGKKWKTMCITYLWEGKKCSCLEWKNYATVCSSSRKEELTLTVVKIWDVRRFLSKE